MLRQLALHIVGDWQPVAYVGRLEWHGIARAEEPITALALLRDAKGITWARAGRGGANELDLRLSVQPGPSEARADVAMFLTIQPRDVPQGDGVAHVHTQVRLTATAPFMFSLNHWTTGVPAWFAQLWTEGDVRFGALFVAEAETRSARNHLWHLAEGIEASTSQFTEALNYGRAVHLA